MNLTMNAMDAMAKTEERLTVTTRRVVCLDKSGWVEIEVADTGCGIAPADLPHVFDPLFTTKHKSTEHVGTGLGLSIVHQIIQEHGGRVEIRSTVSKSTSFLITLPEGKDSGPDVSTCFVRMARRDHYCSPYPHSPTNRLSGGSIHLNHTKRFVGYIHSIRSRSSPISLVQWHCVQRANSLPTCRSFAL